MNKRKYLIRESLKKKIKSKWFIGINIFIFLILFVIINIGSIINFFGGDYKQPKYIQVIDNMNIYDQYKDNLERATKYYTTPLMVSKSTDTREEAIEKAKSDNNVIVLIVNEDQENIMSIELISNNRINDITKNYITNSFNSIRYNMAVEKSGLTDEQLRILNSGIKVEENILINNQQEQQVPESNNTNQMDDTLGIVAVVVFTLPFFFIITTLVQMIGAEINEEKSTKSMEIIISNVSPKDHLLAKIISCTTFTIIQIIVLGLSLGISILFRNKFGTEIVTSNTEIIKDVITTITGQNIMSSVITILPLLILFLVFTLITYSIVAGVLASMTTNIDDFQQLQTPIMLTISIGFYLSILAAIFEGSIFIKIMSFVPLISFMLSPSLFILGQISFAAVIVSTIIQILFTFLVYKYGLKVYRIGILNYSGDHLWKKIFKALKS